MSKLMAVLLVVIFAAVGCARDSAQETLPAVVLESVRPSESQACSNVCLIRLQSCTDAGGEAECAAENEQCMRSCAETQSGRVYVFYCQAEIVARRGLVMSDGSCTGPAGQTLDEQQAECERRFEPPSATAAYTVNCRPVLTWVNAGAGVNGALASSRPTQGQH